MDFKETSNLQTLLLTLNKTHKDDFRYKAVGSSLYP